MQLIINIFRVVATNIITLASNIVLGLILPAFLSVGDYGQYRLFLFYVGYIGFLHFGFIDAIYLKYGGMNTERINREVLKKEHRVFLVYQLTIALIIFLVAMLLKNQFIILFALVIIPLNVGSFHKLFYQATGQFKKYSYVNIMYTILNLILITSLLLLKTKNSISYIIVTLLAYLVVYLIMEVDFYRFTKGVVLRGRVNILGYNKVGIFILIGNICVMLITYIGLWIVQFFFTIEDFAHYSFSVSMMNMVLLVINAVGLTLYNYIAKKEDKEKLILIKELLLVIGALAGSVYFILTLIIESVLSEYKVALNIIAISFMMFPYLMTINVIIINLYKARKQEKRYFRVVISILLSGMVLNGLAYLMFHSMSSIAFATLLSFIIWYIYSTCIEFTFLRGSSKELLFLVAHGLTFLISTNYFTWYYGLLIYLSIIIIMSLIVYRYNIKHVLKKIRIYKKLRVV